MKVVAFNGSARLDGNTAILLKTVLAELEKEGLATELIQLAGKQLRGCMACYKCFERKNKRCANDSDELNLYIEKILESDGVILGSPTYFGDLTSELKALIDRAGFVGRANDNMYQRKVGAGVAVARRAGALHTVDSINHFFLLSQMIIPGSSYWALGFGRNKGEVEQDAEGLETMRNLGRNMAWLIKKLKA